VERILGAIFGLSSVLTPFALGAAIGGIASGRVPVGTPRAIRSIRGSIRSRRGVPPRWLAAGSVAGAVAIGGLLVLHSDPERIYDGRPLTPGGGCSGLCGGRDRDDPMGCPPAPGGDALVGRCRDRRRRVGGGAVLAILWAVRRLVPPRRL
jgi:hypothetical protein